MSFDKEVSMADDNSVKLADDMESFILFLEEELAEQFDLQIEKTGKGIFPPGTIIEIIIPGKFKDLLIDKEFGHNFCFEYCNTGWIDCKIIQRGEKLICILQA
jgi:hypothetical protein